MTASSSTSSVAFFTDQYELTMVEAALGSGTAERQCVFEVFARHLPAGRRYGVVAGTGRFLERLENFRFSGAELDFLRRREILQDSTLEYLRDFRFTGTMIGYAEGEMYFPHSPVLQVQGSFAEACLLETFVLSVFNHDSAVASAGSRMTLAANGRPCVEMGSRRTQEHSAYAAARAAAVVGFSGTSNLHAGQRWDIPTMGTSAHAFTLLHDSEEEAFAAQVAALGPGTTLLVDTYDVERAVLAAVNIAGPELGAVRLDSGDLVEQAFEVRRLLDSLGNTETKIVVSSDLDEHAIARLVAAPVDSFGVGTKFVTGSGAPTASMVYKLVARRSAVSSGRAENYGHALDPKQAPDPKQGLDSPGETQQWESVQKNASGKTSTGGIKEAYRSINAAGIAEAELISTCAARDGLNGFTSDAKSSSQEDEPASLDGYRRRLAVELVRDGVINSDYVGAQAVNRAAQRHQQSLAELPAAAHRLSDGEPVIPTAFRD